MALPPGKPEDADEKQDDKADEFLFHNGTFSR
jgi:hypothetical protein